MRIAIIGHFGGKEKLTDGQTVKTVTLYESMRQANLLNGKIDKVDTYYIKRSPVYFILQFCSCIFRDKKIIVLLSENGRKVLFPLLYFAVIFLRKQVYHYAIGGKLADEVKQNSKWKRYVLSFQGNWMESRSLVTKLRAQDVTNAFYVPNFKRLPKHSLYDLPNVVGEPYKFCTFSRVMEEKGITDAINAIVGINQKVGRKVAMLDIYGPVAPEYKDAFEELISGSNGSCSYGGIIAPEKSADVLKNYYMLLFPTFWKAEGMPGTIIDTLSAGLPVIARRWSYCDEMLADHKTGYIYNEDEPEKLIDCIDYAINNVEETIAMKSNCLEKAKEYSEQNIISKIKKLLEL